MRKPQGCYCWFKSYAWFIMLNQRQTSCQFSIRCNPLYPWGPFALLCFIFLLAFPFYVKHPFCFENVSKNSNVMVSKIRTCPKWVHGSNKIACSLLITFKRVVFLEIPDIKTVWYLGKYSKHAWDDYFVLI